MSAPRQVPAELSISTVSGRRVCLTQPDPSAITIEDIAHSSANLCRYCGHCAPFVSVAEHAVLVSRLVEALITSPFGPALTEGCDGYDLNEVLVVALLHDSAESYVGEVTSPLKKFLGERYAAIERLWSIAIGVRLGIEIPKTLPSIVKLADAMALFVERRDALIVAAARVSLGADPPWSVDELLTDEHRAWLTTLTWARADGLSPAAARHRFLERWVALGGGVSHAVVATHEPLASSAYHEHLVRRAVDAFDRAIAASPIGQDAEQLAALRAQFISDARDRMAQAACIYEVEVKLAMESWQ